MRDFLKKLATVAIGLLLTSPTMAANIPIPPAAGAPYQTPIDPSGLAGYFAAILGAVNQYASGYQPHNFLYNGAMLVNQRGAAERVGGTTSGPTDAEYGPDRWAVDTNVSSGAGYSNEVTSATNVTFAPGLPTMMSVYRKTGALTQPVCAEEFIKSEEFTQLQGRQVILSAWIAANTGLPAGTAVTGYLVTGTGSNEGLGVLRAAVGMTASPAITPALAGVATAVQTLSSAPTTTATRFSSAPIPVPLTATEGVVELCFTPGSETAGTTDGFLFTGAQLEEAETSQLAAGRFERVTYAQELARDQHFYTQWSDGLAATFQLPGTCTEITSGTTAACVLMLPQPQDLAAPVSAVSTAASFGMTEVANGSAEACSTLAVVASSNTPTQIGLTCAASETAAVGTMHIMLYADTGATHTLTVNSDY